MEGILIDVNFHYLSAIAAVIILIRVAYVLYWSGRPLRPRSQSSSLKSLIVLGSGGHTAEMLNLLAVLQMDRFSPRVYVAAATDNMSLQKARVFEDKLLNDQEQGTERKNPSAHFLQIYRSREVGQSYITSVGTTLIAVIHALWITFKTQPQVVICNGPGTCIPLCLCAFLLKMASKLVQLKSKAAEASKFVAKHGCGYYKQVMEENKHFVQHPPSIEKCNELSKQLFYTGMASIPGRYESFWKEMDAVKQMYKNRSELKVEDVGIAALFGLELYAIFCDGEIVGRGFTITGYKV